MVSMAITTPDTTRRRREYAVDTRRPRRTTRPRASDEACGGVRCFGQRPDFPSYDSSMRVKDIRRSLAEFSAKTVTEVMGAPCIDGGAEHRFNRALASPGFRQRLTPDFEAAPERWLTSHRSIEPRGRADLVAEFTAPSGENSSRCSPAQHARTTCALALGMLEPDELRARTLVFEGVRTSSSALQDRRNPGMTFAKLATWRTMDIACGHRDLRLETLFPGIRTTISPRQPIYALLKNPITLRVVATPTLRGCCRGRVR